MLHILQPAVWRRPFMHLLNTMCLLKCCCIVCILHILGSCIIFRHAYTLQLEYLWLRHLFIAMLAGHWPIEFMIFFMVRRLSMRGIFRVLSCYQLVCCRWILPNFKPLKHCFILLNLRGAESKFMMEEPAKLYILNHHRSSKMRWLNMWIDVWLSLVNNTYYWFIINFTIYFHSMQTLVL